MDSVGQEELNIRAALGLGLAGKAMPESDHPKGRALGNGLNGLDQGFLGPLDFRFPARPGIVHGVRGVEDEHVTGRSSQGAQAHRQKRQQEPKFPHHDLLGHPEGV
jgi:hypothetical protein